MLVVTTHGVPAAERLDHFREGARRAWFEFDLESPAPASFWGRIRTYGIGGLRFGRVEGSAMEVRRPRHLVDSTELDGCFFNLHVHGRGTAEQAGRAATLAPGEGFFIEAHRLPFSFRMDDVFEHLSLHIPAAAMQPRLRRMGAVGGRRFTADSYIARMLVAATRAATDSDVPPSPDEAAAIEAHLLALLHSLWSGTVMPGSPYGMERLLPWLEGHLHDPELDLDAAADEMRRSRRSVQQFFHQRGETFTQYIRRRRIERARELLRQPETRGATILEIALEAGFSDLSTFCRAFRQLTGESASAFRRRHRQ